MRILGLAVLANPVADFRKRIQARRARFFGIFDLDAAQAF